MLDFVFRNKTGVRPIVVAVRKTVMANFDRFAFLAKPKKVPGLIQELGDSNGVQLH